LRRLLLVLAATDDEAWFAHRSGASPSRSRLNHFAEACVESGRVPAVRRRAQAGDPPCRRGGASTPSSSPRAAGGLAFDAGSRLHAQGGSRHIVPSTICIGRPKVADAFDGRKLNS
jgi:hypothetical protein